MKIRNRRLILVTVAVTALGVAGASLAAGANEKAGPGDNQSGVAALQPAGVLETRVATAVAQNGGSETGGVLASDDGGSEVEVPITGTDLEKAAAVALAYTGGGRVTETEVGDEESYYEVEVTLDDGSQIDVQLDENFSVVGSESDGLGGS